MGEVKPRRIKYVPHPDPERAKRGEKVKGVLVDFKSIEENWNIYELEDGTRIKLKASINQCNKALDPQTDQLMYREDGSPVYGLEFGIQAVFDYSENVFKKEGGRG